jgi:ribosomal protein S7
LDSHLIRIEQAMGWLIIFDRRQNAPEIADRLNTEIIETAIGKKITVIRA